MPTPQRHGIKRLVLRSQPEKITNGNAQTVKAPNNHLARPVMEIDVE